LVGHLPHLERLASLLLLEDDSSPLLLFPPAGMACLERNPTTRHWLLRWMITPETLE
jgi:phosphohistidine phosphatase